MAILIGTLLAILAVAVLLYPFLRVRFRSRASLGDGTFPAAGVGAREAIYDEIRALQLDHELGSIDEQEYEERLHGYRLEAAAVLRDEERLNSRLEDEIWAARALARNEGQRGGQEHEASPP